MGNCIICKRKLHHPIAVFEHMPAAAQNMPDEAGIATDTDTTLHLHECKGCGLIQFDTEPVAYYKDVIRATKVSEKFCKLRREQYRHFMEVCRLEGKKILEAGCGAGEFLEIWKEFPVDAYGVEHKESLAEAARQQGLQVQQGFIGSEDDRLKEAPFDAFVSFNFLEHQPDPVGMLRGIYENLTEDGVGLITVPSFEYFQEHGSYYEFIRDHIAYYTEETLSRLLELCGFQVIEMKRFNLDTIEAIVIKRKGLQLVDYNGQLEQMQQMFAGITGFFDGQEGIYVWGASHQAFTLLSTIQALHCVEVIIDSAAFKWNKYSPASHIRIVSPEILNQKTPKCIIIMAPGYSDEIYRTIMEKNPMVETVYSVMGEKIIKLK